MAKPHQGVDLADRIFPHQSTTRSGQIIDLGPEGGSDGGEIVAEGTPEDVSKFKKSFTGKFLKDVLS